MKFRKPWRREERRDERYSKQAKGEDRNRREAAGEKPAPESNAAKPKPPGRE
jgi:hypothetical protein